MPAQEFTKMTGCGNDFIVVDNRSGTIAEDNKSNLVRSLCRRKHSLGADGFIFVETSLEADARMVFFNSDGSRGEMCGNGLRCFARYVADAGICSGIMQVETDAGLYVAQVMPDGQVRLAMPPVEFPRRNINLKGLPLLHAALVGVPHAVIFNEEAWDWPDAKFCTEGRKIRTHPFFPYGTNVNFVGRDGSALKVRTFERGVEGETLACGTGATASALVAGMLFPDLACPVTLHTKGGILTVGFQKSRDRFIDVWLQGNALIIARGTLGPDAL